ncbi:MAG: GNAT family N-acetyltransferase [Solirubrobacteraceae bacterium]
MTGTLLDEALLEERRSTLGASTVLWAGVDGVTLGPDRWVALSGAPSVEYNAALVHGDGDLLDQTVEEVLAMGVPTVVMVAGRAGDEVGCLRARRWISVGSTPLMHLDLRSPLAVREARDARAGQAARRLDRHDHAAVTELVGEVFGVGPDLARVAISGVTAGLDGEALWGAFDPAGTLVACLATVRVGETVAVWSMATALAARRRGYGAAALGTALSAAAEEGATSSLLSSSAAGEPLYRALGYRELERWYQWSRPRWVLARR